MILTFVKRTDSILIKCEFALNNQIGFFSNITDIKFQLPLFHVDIQRDRIPL